MARIRKSVTEKTTEAPVTEEIKAGEPVEAAAPEQKEEEKQTEEAVAETKPRARKAAVSKEEKPVAEKKPRVRKSTEKAPAEEAPAKEKKVSARKNVGGKASSAEKKAPAARAAKKAAEMKAAVSVHVQFSEKDYTTEQLVKSAKDVWEYDLGRKPEEFETVELYVKPEESLVYYVINGNVRGNFAI